MKRQAILSPAMCPGQTALFPTGLPKSNAWERIFCTVHPKGVSWREGVMRHNEGVKRDNAELKKKKKNDERSFIPNES